MKNMQKMNFLTLALTKKRERQGKSKNISNSKNINSKTPEKLTLVTLVTNFHKLLLLRLAVRP